MDQWKIIIAPSKKRAKSRVFPLKRFVGGIRRVWSALTEMHTECAPIVSKICMHVLVSVLLLARRNKGLFTLVSLPRNKWMTSKDKLPCCCPDTLTTFVLQMSGLGLTGNEEVCVPFWNERCVEMSEKLWLPTETVSVDSDSNSLNSFFACPEQTSSFSILQAQNPQNNSLQQIYSPSYTSSRADKWDAEGIRVVRVRLYPTLQQRKCMREWMHTARYVYNRINAHVRETNCRDKTKLTSMFITAKTREGVENTNVTPWELQTPKDIRQGMLRDLMKAYQSAFSNLRNGNIQKFQIGFKKRRACSSIEIPDTAIKVCNRRIRIFPTFLRGSLKVSPRQRKNLPTIDKYCRLQCVRNQWFLCIPVKKERVPAKPTRNCCALDPGVRTFQTIYSPEEITKIQHSRDLFRAYRMKLDLLQSKRDQKSISKQSYRRSIDKIYRRVDNVLTEIHYKTIGYLKQFSTVFLPSFESQEMVQGKRLGRKTKREMLGLQHFKFQTRLRDSFALEPNCRLEIVNEAYTSQTCTRCGEKYKPSGDVYKCKHCLLVIDRDVNGARNIFLKYVS